MRRIFVAVANPIYESNSHTKSGWISFNGKGEDSKTDCDDARKHLEIFLFFEKSYLLTAVSFIYSKENSNCINWHLLASISAFIKHVRIQRGEQGVRTPPP